jgi:hypothetical protein
VDQPQDDPKESDPMTRHTAHSRGGNGQIYQGQDDAQAQVRDDRVGREGYAPCPICGRWVRIRQDGTLYNHVTPTKGQTYVGASRKRMARIPCLGGGGIPGPRV